MFNVLRHIIINIQLTSPLIKRTHPRVKKAGKTQGLSIWDLSISSGPML